jgi:release factor glutamine methyltransferase
MRDTALIEEDGTQVTPVKGTLIPRPCTEVLVETALSLIAQHGPARGTLLDLGTGSGCIAVSLLSELVAWRAVAVDLDDTALKVARVNASRVLGDLTRIEFVKSDWTKQLPSREFDLIVANPPYIATAARETLTNTVKHYEPELALFGGVTGLEALEAISSQISQFMKANSYLLLEIGYDQHKQVIELFAQRARLTHVRTVKDYEGFDRCVVFQK